MKIRLVHEARLEFLDAVRYYEAAQQGLGRRFRMEMERTIWRLQDHPETYRIRFADCRRINMNIFPYYISFVIREQTIWLLAVAHESRRPAYWIARRLSADP